eukprot:SAG22_NODE_9298_length_598_cov_0.677355_1_plen_76_part_10
MNIDSYICGEYYFGGIPVWMREHGVECFRCDDPIWEREMGRLSASLWARYAHSWRWQVTEIYSLVDTLQRHDALPI